MKMFNYKHYAIGVLFATLIIGCSRPNLTVQKTQLQVREFQTRSFNTKDIRLVMKAMINVLQDEGFIIKTANIELGLLSATKEVEGNRDVMSIGSITIRDTGGIKSTITECSANVSEYGNQVKVRVNFQKKAIDAKGVREVGLTEDEKYYQSFFAKVDKSVFIEKEKL
jgi:hypothetical protein